jgi:hypothetical protein
MNDYGACGLLANIQAESNFKANNLQNTGNKKLNITDEKYTKMVDDGSYTKEEFRKDSQGYGLCQWTFHTRKLALYEYARKKGKSIGDELMQAEFLISEIKNYKEVWNVLCNANTLKEASDIVMLKFERPADQSVKAREKRCNMAIEIYNELCIKKVEVPLYVLKKGAKGDFVKPLQILLNGLGYNCGEVDGSFGSGTEKAVKDFQKSHNLTVDGSVGSKTWSKLLS